MRNALRTSRTRAALALLLAACAEPAPEVEIGSHVRDWRDRVIYQVLVDRFANGDASNDLNVDPGAPNRYHGGDWQGVIDRIEYLQALGVTAVWISPVVKNVEEDAGVASYHGYWTQDFTAVNPHFGDLAKLQELVRRLHDAGIAVILDIVTNHVGQLFYYDINRNGRPDEHVSGSGCVDRDGSVSCGPTAGGTRSPIERVTEYDPDFDPRTVQGRTSLGESGPAPVVWLDDPAINRVPPWPPEFRDPAWYHRKGRVTDWNDREQVLEGDFPGGLKDLASERPDLRRALIDAFSDWISRTDADGFRIDTLKHVEHGFWREFCPAIREHAASLGKDRFFLFGEAFDGDDRLLGEFTQPGELDSVFYFSQKFRVFDDVFQRGAPTHAVEILLSERGNHGDAAQPDGIGVAPARSLVNFLDNHDLPRFLSGADRRALRSALVYLLTEEGIPSLYYGTEQDFSGGNDPANREDLWQGRYDTSGATFRLIRHLTDLRDAYPALRRGEMRFAWTSDRIGDEQDAGILAFERSHEGQTVLVVVNVHDDHASETSGSTLGFGDMRVSFAPGTVLVNVFDDDDDRDAFTVERPADPAEPGGTLVVRVPARGAKILVPEGQAR